MRKTSMRPRSLVIRRRRFIAHAQVQRETVAHLPVVLDEQTPDTSRGSSCTLRFRDRRSGSRRGSKSAIERPVDVAAEDKVSGAAELVDDIDPLPANLAAELEVVASVDPTCPVAPLKAGARELGFQVVADVEEALRLDL